MIRHAPWLSALVCGVVCVALGSEAWATSIAPGREGDVMKLFAPYQDEGVVTDDVTLASIRITSEHITVTLRGPKSAPTATVVLTSRAVYAAGEPSFLVRADPPEDAALRRAQQALLLAIQHNDDGTFFDGVQVSGPALVTGLRQSPEAWLSGVLWLIALAALFSPLLSVFARLMRGPRRMQAAGQVSAAVLLLLVALRARLSLPFVPMHANQHAWEDLAVVLDLPAAGAAVSRYLEVYGASWLVARRALLPIFGAHFDGVGLASAWWGATALLLGALAALRAGGTRLTVGVAALALAWMPVAARVGHSESDLVVAQWLMAAGLWLATREGRGALAGLAAVVALLALGHAIGPAFALGLVLMALSLRPAATEPAEAAAAAQATPATPATSPAGATTGTQIGAWTGGVVGGGRDGGSMGRHGAAAATLLVALAGATAIRLLSAGAHVGERLLVTEQAVPIPLQPWKFSLWLSPAYASTGLCALALLGLAGALFARWQGARWRGLLAEAPLWSGFAVVTAAGLVVCACLTDGQRYQSVLMAPMLLVAGRAGLTWRHGPPGWRWAFGVACVVALTVTAVETGRGFAGRSVIDSQGQQWLHLRAALHHLRGTITFVRPSRRAKHGAVFEVPSGRWSADGPVSVAIEAASAIEDCRRGATLPEPTFVARVAACDTSVATGPRGAMSAAPLCGDALSLRAPGPPLAALPIVALRPLFPRGLPGEFLTFSHREVPWRLFRAACAPRATQ